MFDDPLTQEAMALPLAERVLLAQALWRSIDEGLTEESPDTEERAAIDEALRRDAEMRNGAVTGRTHQEVMDAARRSIG